MLKIEIIIFSLEEIHVHSCYQFLKTSGDQGLKEASRASVYGVYHRRNTHAGFYSSNTITHVCITPTLAGRAASTQTDVGRPKLISVVANVAFENFGLKHV